MQKDLEDFIVKMEWDIDKVSKSKIIDFDIIDSLSPMQKLALAFFSLSQAYFKLYNKYCIYILCWLFN